VKGPSSIQAAIRRSCALLDGGVLRNLCTVHEHFLAL
jgi:hypothetical protein